MGSILRLDGPVMTFLGKVADVMILGMLWLVCCIPVITIGSSTAAIYYVTLKMSRNEETHIVRQFFAALKDNLFQGMAYAALFALAGVALFVNYWMIVSAYGKLETVMLVVFSLLAISLASTVLYTFPLQAQFRNSVFGTIRNAFFLSIQNWPITIGLLVLNLIPVAVFIFVPDVFMESLPIWIGLAPGGISYICAKSCSKLFEPLMEQAINSETVSEEAVETF